MDGVWLLVSIACMTVSVLAYGLAGAQLHEGSRAEGGSLRSPAWWLGTGLQTLGFLAALVARRSLPVLVVQAAGSVGLAVTAAVEHLTGSHRLTRRTGLLVLAVVVGLGLIAVSSVPGPAAQIRPAHEMLLGACCVGSLLALPFRLPPFVSGLLSGLGFAYAAIGARLVMGDTQHPLWIFWHLPLNTWVIGLLTGTGIVLGQVYLTKGLASPDAAPVLGAMYLVETLFTAAIGVLLLGEFPRHGFTAVLAVGVVAATAGSVALAREV